MFEDRTPEAIKQEILAALTTGLDKREGSFTDDMVGPVALELYRMYQSLNALVPIFYVDEGSGEYVDIQASYWNLTRKPGVKARAQCTLAGRTGVTLPEGTVFLSEEGMRFLSLEVCVLEDGAGSVQVEAALEGEAGNVPAGSIRRLERNLAGVDTVENPQQAQGGADRESTRALLDRLNQVRRKPRTSGNVHDYEAWALQTPGVGAAKVFPLWDGPGTVKVVIADQRLRPVAPQVAAACLEGIERERPIGVKAVTVESARPRPVSVSATVLLDGSATLEEVQAGFTSALEGYLSSIAFSRDLLAYHQVLLRLLLVKGVADCQGLLVNGQTGNLTLMEEELPVVSGVELYGSV